MKEFLEIYRIIIYIDCILSQISEEKRSEILSKISVKKQRELKKAMKNLRKILELSVK